MTRATWIRLAKRLFGSGSFSRLADIQITLLESQVDLLWPFHIMMRDGRASRVGPSLMKCLDLPDVAGFPLQTLLELTIPEDLSPVDWLQPECLQDRPLELRSHNGHTFSAELQSLPPQGWLLILQPIAQSIQDLHRYGLTLQDLSLSDPLRQRVLPALLNEGLQELLLQEANKAYTNAETANIEASWLDLRLEE